MSFSNNKMQLDFYPDRGLNELERDFKNINHKTWFCKSHVHQKNDNFIQIIKVIMQGKLFQKCTHFFYCSVLSLGGNENTRQMLQPDMGSIFHIKKSMKYSGHRKLLCELSKLSKFNAFNLLGYLTNTDASILVYKF